MGPRCWGDFAIPIASCHSVSIFLTEEEIGRKEIGFLTSTAKTWNDLMG